MSTRRSNLEAFEQRLDAFAADENSLDQQEPLIQSSEIALFAEPITISTIIEVGGLIIDLLDLLGSPPDFGRWLEEISDQLGRIEILLEDVLDRLEELRVHIDRAFARDAETELLAATDFFADNVAEWRAAPDTPVNLIAMNNALERIQTGAREVIRYGFASYNTVGYALPYETDLLFMTNKSIETKRKAFERYSNYFGKCLDENEPGSVANVRRNAETLAASLSSQFPSRNNLRENLGRVSWSPRILCETTADVIMITSGSLESGFNGEIITENESTGCDSRMRTPNTFFAARSVALSNSKRDEALQPFRERLQQILTAMNSAGEQFRNALGQNALLREAENQVSQVREISTRLRDTAT